MEEAKKKAILALTNVLELNRFDIVRFFQA
jgi:hypothetical protein